jgi:hypothetical protein
MIRYYPSKILQRVSFILLGLVLFWIVFCPINLTIKIFLSVLLCAISYQQIRCFAQQQKSEIRIACKRGEWLLSTQNGPALAINILKSSRIWPKMINLKYHIVQNHSQLKKQHQQNLLILSDSMKPQEFRLLKIALLEHLTYSENELWAAPKVYLNTSSPSSQLLNGESAE